jgi:hypothetical protein
MAATLKESHVSDWRGVEVYATFMRITGELEVVRPDRLSDSVNRFGDYIHLRNARSQPLSVDVPVLSRVEAALTLRKSAVILICPTEYTEESNRSMWRAKEPQAAAINTEAFSLVGDLHLDHRVTLEDHLQRFAGDFIPVTGLSALWFAAVTQATHSLQRPLGLLNPSSVLSFAPR